MSSRRLSGEAGPSGPSKKQKLNTIENTALPAPRAQRSETSALQCLPSGQTSALQCLDQPSKGSKASAGLPLVTDEAELSNDRDDEAGLIEDLHEELHSLSSHSKAMLDQIQSGMAPPHTEPSPESQQCDEWMKHIALRIFDASLEKYSRDNSPFHCTTQRFLSQTYHLRHELIAKGLEAFSTLAKAAIAAHDNGLRTFDTLKSLPCEDELPFDKCFALYNILGVDATVPTGAKHQFGDYAGMTAAQAGSKVRRDQHRTWLKKGIDAVIKSRKKTENRCLKAYEFLAKEKVQATFHVLAQWLILDETSSAKYTLKFLIQLFESVVMILEGTIDTDDLRMNQATRDLIDRCRTPDMPRSTGAQKPLNSELSIFQPMSGLGIRKKYLTILRDVITNSTSFVLKDIIQEAKSRGFQGGATSARKYWKKWSDDASLPEARHYGADSGRILRVRYPV